MEKTAGASNYILRTLMKSPNEEPLSERDIAQFEKEILYYENKIEEESESYRLKRLRKNSLNFRKDRSKKFDISRSRDKTKFD